MVTIYHQQNEYHISPDESVLDALLRQGVNIANSCRTGVCQSCMIKAERGIPPAKSQVGLKETLKANNYFLPCVCHPQEDLHINTSNSELKITAFIDQLTLLSDDVMLVRLYTANDFQFRAGQFISLIKPDGLTRSYSIASLPQEGYIDLHVKLFPDGKMSGWLFQQARVGDRVSIQGPVGDCFYLAGRPEQPLLLIGTGTGLAPLYAILRDALTLGHQGQIWLFHGAVDAKGLYLHKELYRLAIEYPQFHYVASVLNGKESSSYQVGAIDQLVLQKFPKLTGWRAFLCGNPELVTALKKKLFLAGLSLKDIHADAFIPSVN